MTQKWIDITCVFDNSSVDWFRRSLFLYIHFYLYFHYFDLHLLFTKVIRQIMKFSVFVKPWYLHFIKTDWFIPFPHKNSSYFVVALPIMLCVFPYKLIRPYDRCSLSWCGLIIYLCGLQQIRPYMKWKRIIKK